MSETLACFLPVEKLVFHSELLAPVLFLQTLRRHVFLAFTSPNNIPVVSEGVAPM